MTALRKRETTPFRTEFDRFFDDWFKTFPFRRPEDLIRVDELQDNGEYVIRAELPGIDPDKDVELTVSDHTLHIAATRREEEETETKGYKRHEIRTGSFNRMLTLPTGVDEGDIKAGYKDGILEVRIPQPQREPTKSIPVTKA